MADKNDNKKSNYYLNRGIGFGLIIGSLLGNILKKTGIGAGLGLLMGMLIGGVMDFIKNKGDKEGSSRIMTEGDNFGKTYFGASISSPHKEEKWNQLLEKCREDIVANLKKTTTKEFKEHLINEYDAIEIEMLNEVKRGLKYTVIMNYYPYIFEEIRGMQDEKTEKENMSYFQSVDLIPDEMYGLNFASFKIPRTSKTERFYKELEEDQDYNNLENMIFDIEFSTGYMQLNNGARSLMDEIIIWKGVSEEDINKSTSNFMAYAAAMRDTGRLVYCHKEGKWKKAYENHIKF